MLTKKLLSRIISIVDCRLPSAPATSAEEEDESGLLIANETLMIACRIRTDGAGSYCLFAFDQITGNELMANETCFVDLNKAISAAYEAVNVNAPDIVLLAS